MPPLYIRLLASLSILLALAACTKEANISPLAPSRLTFSGQAGQAVAESQQITFQNTGNAALTYSVATTATWLKISAGGFGTVSPQQTAVFTVRTTCINAPQGISNGVLNLTSNAPAPANFQTVNVQLTCSGTNPSPNPTPNPGAYDIEIRGLGSGFTPARQAVFEQAAALWSSVIIGDLADVTIQENDLPANEACEFGEPAFAGTIDDLLIYASISPIDGPGQILGRAGPSFVRTGNNLTTIGCMQFDVDDVADLEAKGTFDEVILHEMGHVIGIGPLWNTNTRNLLSFTTNPPGQACNTRGVIFTEKPGFTGSNASAEFAALGRSGNVPVEDQGGPGTQCSHWDEEYFSTEIMTGFLGPGSVNPFSRMTIASLKDLGYVVDFSRAEPYSIPACSPNCTRLQSDLEPIREIILSPKFAVSPDGKITTLPTE